MNAVLQFVAHRSKSTLESISCNKALAYAVGVELLGIYFDHRQWPGDNWLIFLDKNLLELPIETHARPLQPS